MAKMRSVDDSISQLIEKVERDVKSDKSLIEDIESIIHCVLDGNFGHVRMSVETDYDGFNHFKLITQEPLGIEEIRKIEKVISMENSWNTYCFWVEYD